MNKQLDAFEFIYSELYLGHLFARISSIFCAQQFFEYLNQLIVLTLHQIQELFGTRATRHGKIAIQILGPVAEFLDTLVGRRQGLLSHMGVITRATLLNTFRSLETSSNYMVSLHLFQTSFSISSTSNKH